jgi:hypothetical protein
MNPAWLALLFMSPVAATVQPSNEPRWLMGQTHVHTAVSGDSTTPIPDVIRWYEQHGFDFIVLTDHNEVSAPSYGGALLVIPGSELTQNPGRCDPPPPEKDGKCRVHLNALFVDPPKGPIPWGDAKKGKRPRRIDLYGRALEATAKMNGIAQLNHPTWHHGVDDKLLIELVKRGVVLLEIANQGFAKENERTERFPGAEDIWDAALTAGSMVWGVASDDAHHYWDAESRRARGHKVYEAHRGFVMVRARREAAAIRIAMARGDFYSSTGVLLDRIEVTEDAIEIDVAADSPGLHRFVFIGAGGKTLSEAEGRQARYRLAEAPRGYVRVVVIDQSGRKAWVQPIWIR